LHKEFGFSCGGGHIAFPQGTGKIAFMSFDLVSQRSLGVGRLLWRRHGDMTTRSGVQAVIAAFDKWRDRKCFPTPQSSCQ
ncbi:MAG: hypothetical protein WBL72_18780, partial [Thermoguttaceae bacterium]